MEKETWYPFCVQKKSIQYNRILGGIMPKAILSVLCYYHQCHFIQQKQQQHLPASDRTKTPTAQRHHLFRIPFVIPAALAFYCCTIPSYYFYIHVMCCYLLTEKKFHRIRYGFPASRFVKTENLNLNCFAYVYKILGEFPNPTTRPHPPSFTSRLYFSPHFQDIEFWFVYRIPINVLLYLTIPNTKTNFIQMLTDISLIGK